MESNSFDEFQRRLNLAGCGKTFPVSAARDSILV